MAESLLRVGFFLDGYTLKKVNEYYRVHHRFHANLDFRGLKSWVQVQVNRYFNPDNKIVAMDSHYYHPQKNPHIYCKGRQGVFKLEFELHNAGYQIHYSDRVGDDGQPGPNLSLIEDAVVFASYCNMDAAVLLTTQGQYTSAADKLRSLGVPVLLLGWNFSYPKDKRSIHWKTDTCLRESCSHYVAMEKVVDRNPKSDQPPLGFFFQPAIKACSAASSASRC